MLKSLQHGSPISKISKSWRLESSLETIQQTLASISVIISRHARRSTNKVAYCIENKILRNVEYVWDKPWNPIEEEGFSLDCTTIAR
jgi:hypothetical protein